jgi:hypothetical protein
MADGRRQGTGEALWCVSASPWVVLMAMIVRKESKSMSKKSNVNADHYKSAGRDRPGDDILHAQNKHKLTQTKAASRASAPKMIPGAQSGGQASQTTESAEADEQAHSHEGREQVHETAHVTVDTLAHAAKRPGVS